jgi:hypothetical protein
MNLCWRKSTNEREGKPEQKFDAAFETNFRIVKCFQRSKHAEILHLFFSLTRQIKNVKFIVCVQKYKFNFMGLPDGLLWDIISLDQTNQFVPFTRALHALPAGVQLTEYI